jgi:hypothetical protein
MMFGELSPHHGAEILSGTYHAFDFEKNAGRYRVRYGIALIAALTRAVCSRDWYLICGWDWQRYVSFLRLLEDQEVFIRILLSAKVCRVTEKGHRKGHNINLKQKKHLQN